MYVSRLLGIFFELLAQLGNVNIHCTVVDIGVNTTNGFNKGVTAKYFAGVQQKKLHNLEF
ncbi:hypothetical protein D1872_354270 [compost metagenome]